MVDNSALVLEEFWTAVNIWLKNPHVVNRRLSGVTNITSVYFMSNELDKNRFIQELLKSNYADIVNPSYLTELSNKLNIESHEVKNSSFSTFEEIQDLLPKPDVLCVLQKAVPRGSNFKEAYRFCIFDFHEERASFINKFDQSSALLECVPDIPYCLKLKNKSIVLEYLSEIKNNKTTLWLEETLISKLQKWASNTKENVGIVKGSLNLVPLDKYNSKYQYLKLKYGREMVKIWPECTDPSKYVYEDVAIASYLLLLWEEERTKNNLSKKQSFVDLGCGNGLLVYILASEGHVGKGIDVRKRDIWSLYPDFVKLEIESVTPSLDYLYKDTDWIIGNHSDELTPWIPVIAARSSYNTNFFLLPCCSYEFDGSKYQRSNSSKSQYTEYIEYVKEICQKCGISTSLDRLKIPSTKRICLVGTDRLFNKDDYDTKIEEIKTFVHSRCNNRPHAVIHEKKSEDSSHLDCWVPDYKPRESTERVRNCTRIDKKIVNEIIESVTLSLLKDKNYLSKWNAGGCIPLNEIVKSLPVDTLKMLKQECGGLQTLLRNHHHIFEVASGKVKLRYPRTRSEVIKELTEKQSKKRAKKDIILNRKPCWFNLKHPDGCPLSDMDCSYIHESCTSL